MADPIVSVVIPTYNRADLLRETLASVMAQDFPASDLEVIVVDDGSTDNTAQSVRAFDRPIHYLQQQNSGRPAVARNAGVRAARGRYIAFLDSDDLWAPAKLRRQVAVLDRQQEIGLVCTNALVLRETRRAPEERFHEDSRELRGADALPVLLGGNFIICSSVLLRAEVLRRAGDFCEERALRGLEDYDLWLRCAAVAGVCYLPEPLVTYRLAAGDNLSSNQRRLEFAEASLRIHLRIRDWLAAHGRAVRDGALARNWMQARRALYKAYAEEGDYLRASLPWLQVQWIKLRWPRTRR